MQRGFDTKDDDDPGKTDKGERAAAEPLDVQAAEDVAWECGQDVHGREEERAIPREPERGEQQDKVVVQHQNASELVVEHDEKGDNGTFAVRRCFEELEGRRAPASAAAACGGSTVEFDLAFHLAELAGG